MLKGKYKHFKGTVYKVVGMAKSSETGEELVLYTSNMNTTQNGGYELAVWARPLESFNDYVDVGGKRVRRFKRVDDV